MEASRHLFARLLMHLLMQLLMHLFAFLSGRVRLPPARRLRPHPEAGRARTGARP